MVRIRVKAHLRGRRHGALRSPAPAHHEETAMSTTVHTAALAHDAETTRTSDPAATDRPDYDGSWTLRQARARYFADNDFGPDGGYNDRWVKLKLGPIPYAIPNTAGRVRAVRYHDLHHIMTGYRTNWIGEFEISAWEVGSGCRDLLAAWFLNLGGTFAGMFLSPRRVFRAFVRGRNTRNLYGRVFDDALLDARVGEVRAELGLDREVPPATAADVVRFVAYVLAGMPMAALTSAPLLVPLFGLAVWLLG
jgi:hypothetical protein